MSVSIAVDAPLVVDHGADAVETLAAMSDCSGASLSEQPCAIRLSFAVHQSQADILDLNVRGPKPLDPMTSGMVWYGWQ
jgi:hypothetical protein